MEPLRGVLIRGMVSLRGEILLSYPSVLISGGWNRGGFVKLFNLMKFGPTTIIC